MWLLIHDYIVLLSKLIQQMLYVGIYELWLLLLVMWQVGDSLHVLILILYHLSVEHEGAGFFY